MKYVLGPQSENLASIRYPPVVDFGFGEGYNASTYSQINLDWEFFYNYLGMKMKDAILEVRL